MPGTMPGAGDPVTQGTSSLPSRIPLRGALARPWMLELDLEHDKHKSHWTTRKVEWNRHDNHNSRGTKIILRWTSHGSDSRSFRRRFNWYLALPHLKRQSAWFLGKDEASGIWRFWVQTLFCCWLAAGKSFALLSLISSLVKMESVTADFRPLWRLSKPLRPKPQLIQGPQHVPFPSSKLHEDSGSLTGSRGFQTF